MARTENELLRDYIGNQVVSLISLTAEVERLRAEVVTLDNQLRVFQDAAKWPAPKPNGRDETAPPVEPRS